MMDVDLIQVKPSTTLTFHLPEPTTSRAVLFNVTLHKIRVRVFSTHPTNWIIVPGVMTLESFEERQIRVTPRLYQESNLEDYLLNKIVLYVSDQDQQGDVWSQQGISPQHLEKVQRLQINISYCLDQGSFSFIKKESRQPILRVSKLTQGKITPDDKACLIEYMETLGDIEEFYSLQGEVLLVKYRQLKQDVAEIKEFTNIQSRIVLYAIGMQPWMIFPENHAEYFPEVAQSPQEYRSYEQLDLAGQYPIQEHQRNPLDQLDQALQPELQSCFRQGRRFKSSKFNQQPICNQNQINRNQRVSISSDQLLQILNSKASEISSETNHNPEFNFANGYRKSQIVSKPNASGRVSYIQRISRQFPAQQHPGQPSLQCIEVVSTAHKPLDVHILSGSRFAFLFPGYVFIYNSLCQIRNSGQFIQLGELDCWEDCPVAMKSSSDTLIVTCSVYFYVIDMITKICRSGSLDGGILDLVMVAEHSIIVVGTKSPTGQPTLNQNKTQARVRTLCSSALSHKSTLELEYQGEVYQLDNFQNNLIVAALGKHDRILVFHFLNIISHSEIETMFKFDMYQVSVLEIKQVKVVLRQIYILEKTVIENEVFTFVKHLEIGFEGGLSASTYTLPIGDGRFSQLTTDNQTMLLADPTNQQVVVYSLINKNSVRVPSAQACQKLIVNFPYLFIIRKANIEIQEFRNVNLGHR